MELLDRMQNKIGPLPTWAWVAIPAGGYVALSYFRASRSADEGPVAENISDSSAVDEYGINTGSSYLPSYGAAPAGSSQLPSISTPQFDNLSWSKQAINYLITEGVSPTDAATAINAYINGFPTTLNSTQFNALQKALTRFGPAPDGSTYLPTLATPTTPTPTTAVPEAPTTVTATASGAGFVVKWGAPQQTGGSPIIGYQIRWEGYDGKSYRNLGSTLALPSARSHTITPATKGRWYKIYVKARNAKGYGPEAGTGFKMP